VNGALALAALFPWLAGLQGDEAPAADASGWWRDLAVTLHANVLGRMDDAVVVDPASGAEVDDRLRVRRVDLDVEGPIALFDDLARASFVVTASLVADPVNDFAAELEEGYLALDRWACLGDSGWTFEVDVGRFRSAFGFLNELRVFELPQPTRSLVVRRFLGEDGFVQTGARGRLAVGEGSAHELALTVEGLDNGDLGVSETSGDEAFASTASLDWAWTPGEGCDRLRTGVSAYRGKQNGLRDDRAHLLDVSAVWTSLPGAGEVGRGWSAGVEGVRAWLDRPSGGVDEPEGVTAWGQVELTERWIVGARWDRVDDLVDPSLVTDVGGVFLHWLAGRDVRLAVGYEQVSSDDATDGAQSVFVELTFAAGSHPTRPYWTR